VDFVTPPMQATGQAMADGTALDEVSDGAVVSGEGSGPALAQAVDTAEAMGRGPFIRHGAQGTPRLTGLTP
jgi:hypothetical protein